VDQLLAGQDQAKANFRPFDLAAAAADVGLTKAVDQRVGGMRLVAAWREHPVRVDTSQFIVLQLDGNQHVANLLLGFIDPESDANGNDGSRLPVLNGVLRSLLGCADAAGSYFTQGMDHAQSAMQTQLVIR